MADRGIVIRTRVAAGHDGRSAMPGMPSPSGSPATVTGRARRREIQVEGVPAVIGQLLGYGHEGLPVPAVSALVLRVAVGTR